jgi:hypothetical protein
MIVIMAWGIILKSEAESMPFTIEKTKQHKIAECVLLLLPGRACFDLMYLVRTMALAPLPGSNSSGISSATKLLHC